MKPFPGATYQLPCISDTYITISNSSNYSYEVAAKIISSLCVCVGVVTAT